jgi:uncharacterized protein
LLGLSVLFTTPLRLAGLPASILIGPMLAGIVMSVSGRSVRIPEVPFALAQGVLGALIATVLTSAILTEVFYEGPLFLAGVLFVIVAATCSGFVLARLGVMPGTTALWGSSPGAATAMTLISEAYGGDMRLVAFMQYARVLCVAISATVVARLWGHAANGAVTHGGAGSWRALIETVVVIAVGVAIARRLHRPAAQLMLPLILCVALQDTGMLVIALPSWLLIVAYTILGWGIGLRFTPAIVRHAAKSMPFVLLAIGCLMAVSGIMAAILVRWEHVTPLTAFLATSPGGEDTVAIIAASCPDVNMSFVMAMQTVRFVLVLFTGPGLARLFARWLA